MLTQLAQYYRQPIMHDPSSSWMNAFFMLVCLGVLIVGIILIVRLMSEQKTNNSDANMPQRGPLDIAKERYAKGEITKEDLSEIRKELSADETPQTIPNST